MSSPQPAPHEDMPDRGPGLSGAPRDRAREWLLRFGRRAGPTEVARLADHLADAEDAGARGDAWRALVMHGTVPTADAVTRKADAANRRRTVAETTQAYLTATAGAHVADVVAQLRADAGQGPTWLEVKTALGWDLDRAQWDHVMHAHRRRGYLTFTHQGHSLDVGPRHQPGPAAAAAANTLEVAHTDNPPNA